MMALELPFKGKDTQAFVKKIINDDPPAITADYSSDLKAVLNGLLRKTPTSRLTAIESLQLPLLYPRAAGKFLLIYICNFHVLSNLLLIYICKLHWNLSVCKQLQT